MLPCQLLPQLTSLIVDQSSQFSDEVVFRQKEAKSKVQHDKRSFLNSEAMSCTCRAYQRLSACCTLGSREGCLQLANLIPYPFWSMVTSSIRTISEML